MAPAGSTPLASGSLRARLASGSSRLPVRLRSPVALEFKSHPGRFRLLLRSEIGESPAAWSYMVLFFLRFSLDGGKKTLLGSLATVALRPRIAAVRRHIAFKSPVAGSDRGRSHQKGGDPRMAARKKATRKKATRRKATRKKATAARATRKRAGGTRPRSAKPRKKDG